MNDIYVLKSGMTKEQMFRLRLINGFNFAPIIADAIIDLSKDFFQNDDSGVFNGQILYLAISDEEGPGKSILDSKHVEVILTLDAPEDMDVYEKFGLSAYRQHILLRITQEARDQNALLTIKDLVKLLKSSYSTIKRDIKHFRERELYVPLRGIVKDIGPSSHKSKIVELYVKGYTSTEIQRSTRHSLQSIERYIKDFSRVSILTQREESIDNIRLIVGISELLVKEYQELFIKYKDGDHKQRVEELIDNVTVYDSPVSFKKNAGMRM
ncbi:hypothetical protein MSSAC_2021 [Methanosarcina siciliae C2J]|uniref:DUF1670 domain-containing protein n=1 Tax=Methanosarcina siciliae C2J TaxID=1434118 RepID=A0A0E3LD41_9EURY|nr:DUF1670 domain-containing protein [Methanosarcina siciliae]AKB36611.1 hypothetical protein MSSAC_2021 [Methanosarcina siciliae C2J]